MKERRRKGALGAFLENSMPFRHPFQAQHVDLLFKPSKKSPSRRRIILTMNMLTMYFYYILFDFIDRLYVTVFIEKFG